MFNNDLGNMWEVVATGVKWFDSSTARSYTGISITIPACQFFIVEGFLQYANNKPEYIGISTSDSSFSDVASSPAGFDRAIVHKVGSVPEGRSITYYLWAKYQGASQNCGYIGAHYIPL